MAKLIEYIQKHKEKYYVRVQLVGMIGTEDPVNTIRIFALQGRNSEMRRRC